MNYRAAAWGMGGMRIFESGQLIVESWEGMHGARGMGHGAWIDSFREL